MRVTSQWGHTATQGDTPTRPSMERGGGVSIGEFHPSQVAFNVPYLEGPSPLRERGARGSGGGGDGRSPSGFGRWCVATTNVHLSEADAQSVHLAVCVWCVCVCVCACVCVFGACVSMIHTVCMCGKTKNDR